MDNVRAPLPDVDRNGLQAGDAVLDAGMRRVLRCTVQAARATSERHRQGGSRVDSKHLSEVGRRLPLPFAISVARESSARAFFLMVSLLLLSGICHAQCELDWAAIGKQLHPGRTV